MIKHYYIIEKVDKIGGNIVVEDYGYVYTQEEATIINSIYEKPFLDWYNDNIEAICGEGGVCYFNDNSAYYRCYSMVPTLGERNIKFIKDVNNI